VRSATSDIANMASERDLATLFTPHQLGDWVMSRQERAGATARRHDASMARLEQQLGELNGQLAEYERLLQLLKVLPLKLKHRTMAPVGPLAFIPATIERTNEVLVDLGGGFFAWQSSYAAQRSLIRRLTVLSQEIAKGKAALNALTGAPQDEQASAGEVPEQPAAAHHPASVGRQTDSITRKVTFDLDATQTATTADAPGELKELRLSLEEAQSIQEAATEIESDRRAQQMNEGTPAKSERYQVSDDDHAALMAKFEELARLEEEAEANSEATEAAQEDELDAPTEAIPSGFSTPGVIPPKPILKTASESSFPLVSSTTEARQPGSSPAVLGRVVERTEPTPGGTGSGSAQPPVAPDQREATQRKVSLFKQRMQEKQMKQ